MNKGLLIAGGIFNVLFSGLHIKMGWQIPSVPGLPEGIEPLLQMLNLAVALTVIFSAVVSFACGADLQASRLGRLTLGFIAVFYLTRAAGEFLFSPSPNFLIFAICLLVAALYGIVLARSLRTSPAPAR